MGIYTWFCGARHINYHVNDGSAGRKIDYGVRLEQYGDHDVIRGKGQRGGSRGQNDCKTRFIERFMNTRVRFHIIFQDACDRVRLELHGAIVGWARHERYFDWNALYAISWTRFGWGLCGRGSGSGKKKEKKIEKLRQGARREYERRARPRAAVRCPPLWSPLKANAFPSSPGERNISPEVLVG